MRGTFEYAMNKCNRKNRIEDFANWMRIVAQTLQRKRLLFVEIGSDSYVPEVLNAHVNESKIKTYFF